MISKKYPADNIVDFFEYKVPKQLRDVIRHNVAFKGEIKIGFEDESLKMDVINWVTGTEVNCEEVDGELRIWKE